jgi:Ca2+-binding EF-hand superfamily protein
MAIAVMRLRTVAAGVVAPARVLRPARVHRRCPQQVRRRWASTGEADAQTLQQAEAALSRNPELVDTLVEHLSPEIRQRLMMAAVRADHSGVAAAAFTEADLNKDGKLTPEEFQQWMAATASATPKAVSVSRLQIKQMAMYTAVPMVGFGFMDNMIMIIAGDVIENSIGLTFGLTTLCAAGFGNLISDVAGLGLGGYIEASSAKLGITKPMLSRAQEDTKVMGRTRAAANLIGISIGCLIGMFPLLFIDEEKKQLRAMFDELDVSHDGKISAKELQSGLQKVGLGLSDAAIEEFLRSADVDMSGSLDFTEFCALAQKVKQLRINHSKSDS